METAQRQRTYDHRLRELVQESRDISIATRLGVPRSTAAGWLRTPKKPVITAPDASASEAMLRAELVTLRRKVRRLSALLRVLFALLRAFHLDLSRTRVPDGSDKQRLLGSIERAREFLHFRHILTPLGLSPSRFHAWRRAERGCELKDMPSCPKSSPQQLTPEEIRTIRDMVTSSEYRHVPTGTLALLAQRLGKVFASATTWYRLVREYGWRRPRLRIHPQKPKLGIRATRPDETWHIDATVIKLLDGSRAYLHGVIDNFSRRILAWRLTKRFDPTSTVAILVQAAHARENPDEPPMVLVDGGVENMNSRVDELIETDLLNRVLALTDLHFSNSMIECFWRTLKHQWLFLNQLESVEKLRRLIAYYIEQHNSEMPHSAFKGQTPD